MKTVLKFLAVLPLVLGLSAQAQLSLQNQQNSRSVGLQYRWGNAQATVTLIRGLFNKGDYPTLINLIQQTDRNDYFFLALSYVLSEQVSRPNMPGLS